jgi:hypothetical protein
MKKIFIIIAFVISNFLFSQENQKVKNNTKFQVEIHYVGNVRNNNIISDGFNGIVGISGNFVFYQNHLLALSTGLNIDYLQSRDLFLLKNLIIWNPNLSFEIDLFKSKLKPFIGIGYAFFNSEFYVSSIFSDPFDPVFYEGGDVKVKFNGFTIHPGLKYHVSELFFIEGSYKYFPVNSHDIEGTSNTHFINFGLGVKF